MVDLSKQVDEIKKAIEFWSKFIQSHVSSSPSKRHSTVVIGNKTDISNESTQQVRQYVTEKRWEFVAISATKCHNMESLKSVITKECNELLQVQNSFFKIPTAYSLIENQIEKQNSLIISMASIANEKVDVVYCLNYLQDIGVILFNRNTHMICTDPQLLGKTMACFLMPNSQISHYFGGSTFRHTSIQTQVRFLSSLLLKTQITERFRNFKSILIKKNAVREINEEELLSCLLHFDFCAKITEEEKEIYGIRNVTEDCYIFPCLRAVDQFLDMPKVKILGVWIRDTNGKLIGSNFFFRLQLISRIYQDYNSEVHANCFRLQHRGNFGLIWMDQYQSHIQVVIKGTNPPSLWNEIKRFLIQNASNFSGIELTYNFLCPKCMLPAINGQKLTALPSVLKNSMFKETEIHESNNVCAGGHTLDKQTLLEGMETEVSSRYQPHPKEIQEITIYLQSQHDEYFTKAISSQLIELRFHIIAQEFWNFLGRSFPQIRDTFTSVQYYPIPNHEKVVMILVMLEQAVHQVMLVDFVQVVKKIATFVEHQVDTDRPIQQ